MIIETLSSDRINRKPFQNGRDIFKMKAWFGFNVIKIQRPGFSVNLSLLKKEEYRGIKK